MKFRIVCILAYRWRLLLLFHSHRVDSEHDTTAMRPAQTWNTTVKLDDLPNTQKVADNLSEYELVLLGNSSCTPFQYLV